MKINYVITWEIFVWGPRIKIINHVITWDILIESFRTKKANRVRNYLPIDID